MTLTKQDLQAITGIFQDETKKIIQAEIKSFATKQNFDQFATKKDFEQFATKKDIRDLREGQKQFATKKDIRNLEEGQERVEQRCATLGAGQKSMLKGQIEIKKDVADNLREIRENRIFLLEHEHIKKEEPWE